MNRLSRKDYYLNIAKLVAQRSTCIRASVGAVLVYENRIVATGYNGSISKEDHCIEKGCLIHNNHCIRTIHAEINSLLHLEHNYIGMTLYCTHSPCLNCFKALVSAGVTKIIYIYHYEDLARDLFAENLKNKVVMEQELY